MNDSAKDSERGRLAKQRVAALEAAFAGTTLNNSIGIITGYLAAALAIGNENSDRNTAGLAHTFKDSLPRMLTFLKETAPNLKAAQESPHIQEVIRRAQETENARMEEQFGKDEDEDEPDYEERLGDSPVRRVFTSWSDQTQSLPDALSSMHQLRRLFGGVLLGEMHYAIVLFAAIQLHVRGETSPQAVEHVSELFSLGLQVDSEFFHKYPWFLAKRPTGFLARLQQGFRWITRTRT